MGTAVTEVCGLCGGRGATHYTLHTRRVVGRQQKAALYTLHGKSPTRVKNRTVCLSALRHKKSQTGFLVGGVWRRNPSVLSRCAGGVRKQLYVYKEFAIF